MGTAISGTHGSQARPQAVLGDRTRVPWLARLCPHGGLGALPALGGAPCGATCGHWAAVRPQERQHACACVHAPRPALLKPATASQDFSDPPHLAPYRSEPPDRGPTRASMVKQVERCRVHRAQQVAPGAHGTDTERQTRGWGRDGDGLCWTRLETGPSRPWPPPQLPLGLRALLSSPHSQRLG